MPVPSTRQEIPIFSSWYDFMNSLLSPERGVRIAAELGFEAVAMCDPNLHGAVEFFEAAKAAGIKPVLGARTVSEGREQLLFVENAEGYRNLCALLSDPEQSPGSADLSGLIRLDARGVPVFRMEKKSDATALRIVRSIRTGTLLNARHPLKNNALPVSYEAGTEVLHKNRMLLRTMERACQRCEFSIETGKPHFPEFHPPDGSSPHDFLAKLAREGLCCRYGSRGEEFSAHLETELRIIAEVGYEGYFLTVWNFLQECAKRGIEWITRGSAADSMVCYCLGISDVCPVRFELYFQRFLNPERMKMHKLPDIDLDFPHDRKDEVVRLIFERHPPGHVAAVGGFNTFQARSAVAEIAKTFGLPESRVRRLTEHFPAYSHAADAERSAESTPAKAGGFFDSEPERTALKMARMLDGMPRHRKIHPCGLVLAERPVRKFCPLFMSDKGWEATHFDMDAVEAAGLVKMDILAQGGLAVMRDTRAMIREKDPEAAVRPPEGWADPGVWEMIAAGRARGVHHIESPAMTTLEKMCDCRDIDTLVAIVSVIRPGAANTLRKASFARRARGLEPACYAHPSLEPVLRLTHGVVAYEEHILQICEVFAGISPGRSDALRRALVKQNDSAISAFRPVFFEAARAAGRKEADIAKVWELLEGFRGYAFCRAHSTAYALEAYEAAWLKKYHPAEFLAAVLSHEKGFYSPLVYSIECRLLGIGLLPPDINHSRALYFPEKTQAGVSLRLPLWKINGLGAETAERILDERKKRGPFSSPEDFVERVGPPPEKAELLLRAGALDGFGLPRTRLFWELLRLEKSRVREAPLLRFEEETPPLPAGLEEPSILQKLRAEWELLGFCVSGHPLDLFPGVAWRTYCPVAGIGEFTGRTVTVCGLLVASRDHFQRDGRLMRFFSLCDYSGMVECEMFADVGARFRLETLRHPVVQVTAKVCELEGGGGWTLRVMRVDKPARG